MGVYLDAGVNEMKMSGGEEGEDLATVGTRVLWRKRCFWLQMDDPKANCSCIDRQIDRKKDGKIERKKDR